MLYHLFLTTLNLEHTEFKQLKVIQMVSQQIRNSGLLSIAWGSSSPF